MKKTLLLCLLSLSVMGQSLQLAWFTQNDQFNIIDSQMDAFGNIIVAGTFSGIVDFDHGPHARIDTAVGIYDMFIAKYDAYGNLKWAHSLGNNNPEKITAIDTDINGNVYAVGEFTRTLDFDPGPGLVNLTAAGYADVFLWVIKANGDLMYARVFGDRSLESPNDIDVNNNGDIVIGGFFWGNADMDPSVGGYAPVFSHGRGDVFIMRLHPGGTIWWVRSVGSALEDQALNVKIADNGDVYAQGFFNDSVDFDPDTTAGEEYWLNTNSGDGFFLKLNPFGLFVSAFNSEVVPQKMQMQNSETLYFSGYFTGTKDFDPDTASVLNLNAVGNQNPLFVWRLDTSWSVDWVRMWGDADIGKNSLFLNRDGSGGAIVSAPFTGSIDLDPSLGANMKTSKGLQDIFVAQIDSAGNYLYGESWGGSQIDYPALAMANNRGEIYVAGRFETLMDFDPDPSIVDNGQSPGLESFMLKLTYCQEGYGYDTIQACNSYTWINSFTYHDTRSGDRYIIPSSSGCDSLVYLALTMNFIDSSATLINDTTFRANQFGATYQWLICDSLLSPIPGATGREFYPDTSGQFAVIVDNGNCIDTSACLQYWEPIGLKENDYAQISAYPNPSNGLVHLDAPYELHGTQILLTDLQGRILFRDQIEGSEDYEFQLPEQSGIYLLHLNREGERTTLRLIRN